MNDPITTEIWLALGLGVVVGVIFGFLVSTGRRLPLIILAGILVATGIWWSISNPDAGPIVVTALLAISIGHVFTVGIRRKLRRRKEEQTGDGPTY
ncbi:MAG: hypothetical protein FWG08_06975 [Propionibacteriaceae bacterium]|nr:hypothetical protein [Propionibacteriaceae bacterium]